MIILENRVNLIFNKNKLENIAKLLSTKEIELMICTNEDIKEYNYQYRNKNNFTDVLSFPINENFEHSILGSIIISEDFIINNSKKYKHKIDDEIALLFIHGILHLLGYDHEIDNGEMRKKEEELVLKLNLPKSLIVRV